VADKSRFKTPFAEHIFRQKYAISPDDSWDNLALRVVDDVCGTVGGTERPLMSKEDRQQLVQYIAEMKFIPGGRYLYYAGRPFKAYNNCYLLKCEEDTREEWSAVTQRAMACLMTGGGIGIDYSVIRPSGRLLGRTGGKASGPIPLMHTINEVGRNVMQGGSRRSAIYASLNWQHEDAQDFLKVKNWHDKKIGDATKRIAGLGAQDYTLWDAKQADFNFPAPLDMTNISLNYDNSFLGTMRCVDDKATKGYKFEVKPEGLPQTFIDNCRQAMSTGEPGFSFNFGAKENETLRNACTEVTSCDDSDVCNLGSVNMGAITSLAEFQDVVSLASKFLVCGTVRADLPYAKVRAVREKNRRLGLGLMGIHEWLLKRGVKYEVGDELRNWLSCYREVSTSSANAHCDRLYLSRPVAYRAIAPTGSIGILASTTTGIEPLFAVAYKRRYLKDGTRWHYEYVVDATADQLIREYGLKAEQIETAKSLATDYGRRIKFQADVQDYVDMSISSTINLPQWGSKENNEDCVDRFASTLATHAHRLRGFTCYPDGSRGGQPITEVPYEEARKHKGVVFEENDVCVISGKGGTCGS
jgi:ribonucleoside-diphosphate reductase alpha chain